MKAPPGRPRPAVSSARHGQRQHHVSLPPALLAAALGLLAAAGGASAADAPPPPEPNIQRQVIEDDNVRIEELRVRGQTQSIVVQSKIRGVAPYRIVPGSGAQDPSQPAQTSGQRVWQFSF